MTSSRPAVPSMLSYASGVSDVPLLGDTIGDNFDRTVAGHPGPGGAGRGRHRPALDLPGSCADEVDALALGLLDAGVGKGDRVGIWAPNCAEWTFMQYATAKIGAILVNINPAYRAHELEYVLNQAGIRMLVSARELQDLRLRRHDRRGPAAAARAGAGGAARLRRVERPA